MTKEKLKLVIVGCVLGLTLGALLVSPRTLISGAQPQASTAAPLSGNQEKQPEQEKPAEQVFKNIQVFKGLPASQLRPAMSFMAASLGVSCEHCHTNPWESDAKSAKQTARQMILMMRRLNQENFAGNTVVNCATCHKGQTKPTSLPPLAQLPAPRESSTPAETKTDTPLPSVAQIFDRYIQALGGKAALDRVTTRVVKASEVSTDGSTSAVEIYTKAPNKLLSITTARPPAKSVYVQGFNGESAWGQFNGGRVSELSGLDLTQVTRDAEFHKGLSYFRAEYATITLKGREKIGEREVYVIEGMNSEDFREWLYFDTKTGLLVRRYGELRTALGRLPFQADYEDYREVDGVRLPFTTRWALPGNGWTDTYTEVKHNVPIDDAKFVKPTPPARKIN